MLNPSTASLPLCISGIGQLLRQYFHNDSDERRPISGRRTAAVVTSIPHASSRCWRLHRHVGGVFRHHAPVLAVRRRRTVFFRLSTALARSHQTRTPVLLDSLRVRRRIRRTGRRHGGRIRSTAARTRLRHAIGQRDGVERRRRQRPRWPSRWAGFIRAAEFLAAWRWRRRVAELRRSEFRQ